MLNSPPVPGRYPLLEQRQMSVICHGIPPSLHHNLATVERVRDPANMSFKLR
jgi:hypothetical protein